MDKKIYNTVNDVKRALETMGIISNRIVLFGSYAKGNADEYSDIDIAVISNSFIDMNLLERLELIGTALAKAKIMEPVEIKAFTEDEFTSKKEGSFTADEIKAKGVEILSEKK